MDTEPIAKAQITLDEQAYFRAFKLHRASHWKALAVGVAIGVALFTCGLIASRDANSPAAKRIANVGAVITIVSILMAVIIPATTNRSVRKQLAQMGRLRRTVTYEVFEDILHTLDEESESRVPWRRFLKWKEGHGVIIMYRSSRFFNLIPIDATDNEFADAVRRCLEKHVRRG